MNKQQWINNEIGKTIKKVEQISEKYHKLNLLFFELGKSLTYYANKCNSVKEFKKEVKDLGLDMEKLKYLSNDFLKSFSIKEIQKNG